MGQLQGIGELWPQIGIAHFEQFGIVVLWENPEFRFPRTVDPAVVEHRQFVVPPQFIGKPCTGEQFEIIVLVIVGIITIDWVQVVENIGLFGTEPRLDIERFLFKDIICVPGIKVLPPIRKTAQTGIDDGLVPRCDGIVHGQSPYPQFGPQFHPARSMATNKTAPRL